MIDLVRRSLRVFLCVQFQQVCYLLYLLSECFYGEAFPVGTDDGFWLLYNEQNSSAGGDIHVRVKRSNDTPVPPKQYANAVEEFYADPNNRAMYLVLPLIVLVYGGCSSIYCIHKCCRYVKRKKLEKDMQKRERLTSDTESCAGIEETDVKRDFGNEATSSAFIDNQKKTNEKELSPPPAYERSPLSEEDLPLEDFEDSSNIHNNQTDKTELQETSFTSEQKHSSVSDYSKHSENGRDMDQANNNGRSSSKTSRSLSRPRPSPPPAYEKRTSPDGKSSKGKEQLELSSRDIEDILNYYSDKKHMPDVIPDDTENVIPLRRKVKKWKQRVFNG